VLKNYPITISLTRYNESDKLLFECLGSLSRQKHVEAKVLVLDQQKENKTEKFCQELNRASRIQFEYSVIDKISLSYARNMAIEMCDTDVLLYIDPDAVAESNWAVELGSVLQKDAAIAGGKILPKWEKRKPWFCRSTIIQELYSILDLGDATFPISRVFGANFGINIYALKESAYFDIELGRKNGKLISGEETDLCDRAQKNGCHIYYCGSATVTHKILSERTNYRWIGKRLFHAGGNRAARGGLINSLRNISSWDYMILPFMITPYLMGYLYKGFAPRKIDRKAMPEILRRMANNNNFLH